MGAVAGESNSDLVALTDEVDEFDSEVWEAVSDPCRTLLELREIEFLFAVVMDIVRRHQLIEPIPLASVVRIEKPVEDLSHGRSIFAGRLSDATGVVHPRMGDADRAHRRGRHLARAPALLRRRAAYLGAWPRRVSCSSMARPPSES